MWPLGLEGEAEILLSVCVEVPAASEALVNVFGVFGGAEGKGLVW